MPELTPEQRLAEANNMILGVLEVVDQTLRRMVGEHIADDNHPTAATSLPGRQLPPDARERLALHLWMQDGGEPEIWDGIPDAIAKLAGTGTTLVEAEPYYWCLRQAEEFLAVATGAEEPHDCLQPTN